MKVSHLINVCGLTLIRHSRSLDFTLKKVKKKKKTKTKQASSACLYVLFSQNANIVELFL